MVPLNELPSTVDSLFVETSFQRHHLFCSYQNLCELDPTRILQSITCISWKTKLPFLVISYDSAPDKEKLNDLFADVHFRNALASNEFHLICGHYQEQKITFALHAEFPPASDGIAAFVVDYNGKRSADIATGLFDASVRVGALDRLREAPVMDLPNLSEVKGKST